jgi:DNA-binding MarR family transcriptional regulator
MLALLGVAHSLEGRLDKSLDEIGLSSAKLGVLTQLIEAKETLPLSVLAERLSCVRSNITQLVDRLEAEGLVRRVDDPADRRAVKAEITPSGRARQSAGAARLAAAQAEFSSALSKVDRAALTRALAALGA